MERDAEGFLDQVKAAAGLESTEEADEATRATLRSMRSVLTAAQRGRLARILPPEYASELLPGESTAGAGPQELHGGLGPKGDGAEPGVRAGGPEARSEAAAGVRKTSEKAGPGDEPGLDASVDRETFIGRMMNRLPTEALWDHTLGGIDLVSVPAGDEAVRRTQAVFAGIKRSLDTEFAEEIAATLPEDIADWFRNA